MLFANYHQNLEAYNGSNNNNETNNANGDEEHIVIENSDNSGSKTLQQSTLIDVEIVQKSQDSSQNLFYEDSAEPMISSQESTPAKRRFTRKFSSTLVSATPMVDVEGTGLHQSLTPMDVENSLRSSTVTKSVVMNTLRPPVKDTSKSVNNIDNPGDINRNADTILANFVGEENGSMLKTDQNQGSVAHFDTKLRTVRRSTFEIDFHELRIGKKLGAGAFGEVRKTRQDIINDAIT